LRSFALLQNAVDAVLKQCALQGHRRWWHHNSSLALLQNVVDAVLKYPGLHGYRRRWHHDRAALRNKLRSMCRQCLLLPWWYLPWNLSSLLVGPEDFYAIRWRALQQLNTIRWRALEKFNAVLGWSLEEF
jgi:hypothetical protein